MSLRQLRTRIERLEHREATSPEPDWDERLWQWRQTKGLNEMERPLTEEEEAEYNELVYRFHPLGLSVKAWKEAADSAEQEDRDRKRRARPK